VRCHVKCGDVESPWVKVKNAKAAFFCLLFFAAAKKSRCCPAQGRSMNQESKTRMPTTSVADKNKTKPSVRQTKNPNSNHPCRCCKVSGTNLHPNRYRTPGCTNLAKVTATPLVHVLLTKVKQGSSTPISRSSASTLVGNP